MFFKSMTVLKSQQLYNFYCLGDVGDLVGKVVYGYDPVSPYGTLQPPYSRNGSANDPRNYEDRPVYQDEASPSVDDDQRGLLFVSKIELIRSGITNIGDGTNGKTMHVIYSVILGYCIFIFTFILLYFYFCCLTVWTLPSGFSSSIRGFVETFRSFVNGFLLRHFTM